MECSTPPRACLASIRSWLACILSPGQWDRAKEITRCVIPPPLRVLATQAGISLRTAYKWLARYLAGGLGELADRRRHQA